MLEVTNIKLLMPDDQRNPFKTQKPDSTESGFLLLSYKDSNLDRLDQNQMCYLYTIGQLKFQKERFQIGSAKLLIILKQTSIC